MDDYKEIWKKVKEEFEMGSFEVIKIKEEEEKRVKEIMK